MLETTVRKSARMAGKAVTEVRVMVESRTVRDVPLMVMHHVVVVPIGAPMVPAPAVAAEDADSNPQAKRNSRPVDVDAGHSNPPRVVWKRISVDHPGVVFRYIDDLRIGRLNRDHLSVRCDRFLLRALQVPGLLRPLTQ